MKMTISKGSELINLARCHPETLDGNN